MNEKRCQNDKIERIKNTILKIEVFDFEISNKNRV